MGGYNQIFIMQNRHFKVIVAGDNAEELMLKYDGRTKVAPYVVYEFSKAGEYRQKFIAFLENLISEMKEKEPDNEERIALLESELEEIKNMSDEDYFVDLGSYPGFETDEETGNIMTTENPLAKYDAYNIGGRFSLPFILKEKKENPEDNEVYTAKKGEIDWEAIHLANQYPYEVAWDTTHGIREPENEDEDRIYQNMKNLTVYFSNFENREHYIASNTAFWGYAFVDENGWHEIEPSEKQFDWVINFYDRFIKPLPEDTRLTIYECVRN